MPPRPHLPKGQKGSPCPAQPACLPYAKPKISTKMQLQKSVWHFNGKYRAKGTRANQDRLEWNHKSVGHRNKPVSPPALLLSPCLAGHMLKIQIYATPRCLLLFLPCFCLPALFARPWTHTPTRTSSLADYPHGPIIYATWLVRNLATAAAESFFLWRLPLKLQHSLRSHFIFICTKMDLVSLRFLVQQSERSTAIVELIEPIRLTPTRLGGAMHRGEVRLAAGFASEL